MNTIKYKYTGKGAIPGIPARDLNEDEVETYGGKKALLATGLWVEEQQGKKIEPSKKQENS